jgi:hypothetical protein
VIQVTGATGITWDSVGSVISLVVVVSGFLIGRYTAVRQSGKQEEKLETRMRDNEREVERLQGEVKEINKWRIRIDRDFTQDNNVKWTVNDERWKKQDGETHANHDFQINVLQALHAILSNAEDDKKKQIDKELYDYLVKRQRPAGGE